MEFEYKGVDLKGASVNGHIHSDSKSLAMAALKKKQITVFDIREKRASSSKATFSNSKVSNEDLVFLTSELSILLTNGIKIDKALKMLTKVKAGTAVGKVIEEISLSLTKGSTISSAFAQFPQYFSFLYINLVEIGEKTGTLKDVFRELEKDLKFRSQIKKRVAQALIYPLIILFVCISAIVFIFNFVVPTMGGIFESREVIPFYTQFILDTSDWLINYQLYLLLGIVLVIAAIIHYWEQPLFKQAFQKVTMKLPLVGRVYEEVERVNFTSAVKLMLSSGLKVNQALELAIGNLSSEKFKDEIRLCVDELKGGGKLNESLSQSSLFPVYYQSLIEVGEETAELENVFGEIVERSKDSFESTVTQVLNMLEPLLIIVLGLIVGGVVVTLMLSITSVNDVGF